MPERSLKGWFKLAFHLFDSEQWDEVREVVEDNDATYIPNSMVGWSSFQFLLITTKDRLFSLGDKPMVKK